MALKKGNNSQGDIRKKHFVLVGTIAFFTLLSLFQIQNPIRYMVPLSSELKTDYDSNKTFTERAIGPATSTHEKNVKCNDGGDCTGFFEYSGPNHAPNATAITLEVAMAYHYGPEKNLDGHLIFFPNSTKSESCIKEWKTAKEKWAYRGMSAWGEDITIYEKFFHNASYISNSHFYMEIGAHDGVRESNSRFFDLCLGWQGVLVEPHPQNYEQMRQLRPSAHHLGIAPSCNTSDVVMFPAHLYTSAVANEKGATLEIHCGPLSYYLDQLGIDDIDFWSLDVEGSELDVLQTVDFDKVSIDVIIAENTNRLPGKEKLAEEVRSYLLQKGYLVLKSVGVHKSDIFLRKGVCHRYSFPECS